MPRPRRTGKPSNSAPVLTLVRRRFTRPGPAPHADVEHLRDPGLVAAKEACGSSAECAGAMTAAEERQAQVPDWGVVKVPTHA